MANWLGSLLLALYRFARAGARPHQRRRLRPAIRGELSQCAKPAGGFYPDLPVGGKTRIESGRVAFARGGLMRWDYRGPTKKLFISDGKQVSLYIPEEHQLTRASAKSSEDFRVPFELLLTRLNLRRVFSRVEMADAALDHDPADHVLRAFPKKEFAEEYTDVLIELGPQFDMRRLVVNYPDHSRMDFRFDHIERNPPLPRSLFQF